MAARNRNRHAVVRELGLADRLGHQLSAQAPQCAGGRAVQARELGAVDGDELHPWVNAISIPAALARLVDDGVLLKRGKTDRGHPKYMMAPEMAESPTPAPSSSDEGE